MVVCGAICSCVPADILAPKNRASSSSCFRGSRAAWKCSILIDAPPPPPVRARRLSLIPAELAVVRRPFVLLLPPVLSSARRPRPSTVLLNPGSGHSEAYMQNPVVVYSSPRMK
uniref:(northern house mosquito) hypothetical protein n=1 Tax=Culex pipiens TaxID=7175 RepID=A0A8D8FDD8_CULPI